MNVLSLFDGISAGQLALQRAGVEIGLYYASEIDPYAIKCTQQNWANTVQLGDVRQVKVSHLKEIGLLIGGSPCQGFSFAGKGLNFEDPRSKLLFEFVRILKECRALNPNVKFFLENVLMKKEYQNVISELVGVQPVLVNSALVSAQKRKRLYWTNIEGFVMPEDKGIAFSSIVENAFPGSMRGRRLDETGTRKDYDFSIKPVQRIEVAEDGKANCLTTVEKDNVVIEDNFLGLVPGVDFRYLTLKEIERAKSKHGSLAIEWGRLISPLI